MASFHRHFLVSCLLAVVWLSAYAYEPVESRQDAETLEKGEDDDVHTFNNCTNKLFPCSQTVVGNLILMVFYGVILGIAAKLIADGAEMLLDVGLPPALVGGLILPVLGAVPDAAIIIVSGMGNKATVQNQLQVGMGTLAGSTIMLLTLPWLGSLLIGRCDIGANGIARDGSGAGRFSLKQGVSVFPDVKNGIIIMFVTVLPFFIIQGADWHLMSTQSHSQLCNISQHGAESPQPSYIRRSALATMIFSFLGLTFYMAFQVYDARAAQRRAERRKEEIMMRRVAQRFYTMTNRNAFQTTDQGDGGGEGQGLLNQEGIQKKYFNAWKVRRSSAAVGAAAAADPEPEKEEGEDDKAEESRSVLALKSISILALGVALVVIFSDPMCDVLTELTNKKNFSHIPVKAFYVSFVVTPICSNASELVSSLMFAAKRKRVNTTMTYSQLYGAAVMNNTLCLGVFMALVYFRNLEWEYSAEMLVIFIVEVIVGIVGFRETYRVWMGIPVACLYIVAIGLVAFLESSVVCWK